MTRGADTGASKARGPATEEGRARVHGAEEGRARVHGAEEGRARVLVTGGAGYIGSHTTVELVAAGYDVVMVDDLSNSRREAVEGVRRIVALNAEVAEARVHEGRAAETRENRADGTHEGRANETPEVAFVEADCTDPKAMDEVFRTWKFDAVIHFAALKAVAGSVAEPLRYYRNNIDSLLTVLETMRRHGVPCVVFSSSATVYGQPDELPVTESTPRRPASSPYGATKQICEDILRDAVAADWNAHGGAGGLRGISLRYFNPIGAHPSALIGEFPIGVPGNLVPFITQTAAGIRPELSIFGDDYPTPDGTAQRDYIDIVDLARAHVVAVERMMGGEMHEETCTGMLSGTPEEMGGEMHPGMRHPYEVFNIGTGKPVSVLELVRTFERVNGITLPVRMAPRRPGDIAAIWADTTLASEQLGWHVVRPLEETLRSAWAWEKHLRRI